MRATISLIFTLLIFGVLIIASHKGPKLQQRYTAYTKYTEPDSIFTLKDTLEKYAAEDSFYRRYYKQECSLFITNANNTTCGLYFKDTLLFIYNKTATWELTDSVTMYDIYADYTNRTDLNGDGYTDIKTGYHSGAGGNFEATVLLFDAITKNFKHNSYYDLSNIEYDKKGHFIRSSWWAGVRHGQTKRKYLITGDSLILDTEVNYRPDDETDGEYANVETIKRKLGGRMVSKTSKGKAEPMWALFEKSLWDSKDDF